MKILIIEDENLAADFLEKLILDNIDDCQIVGKAKNVKEASKLFHTFKPDLLMMDINLGDHLSFDLFEYINPEDLDVIFTTSYQEYAVKAFKVNAIDYVLKPINLQDLKTAIGKARERIKTRQNQLSSLSHNDKEMSGTLLVWESGKLIPVKISDIIKIKADGPYSKLFMTHKKTVHTSKNLGVYETILKDAGFLRIHNSCLINPFHLISYKPGLKASVFLTDDMVEDVSKNKKKDLLKVIRIPIANLG
jgi:two-component system LytT family response regulator